MSSKLLNIDEDIFDRKRFFLLLKHNIIQDNKDILWFWGKVAFIFFLFSLILRLVHRSDFGILLIFDNILSLIMTVSVIMKALNAFPEYRNKEKAIAWMMLPGSNLEKYLSRLFITSIVLLLSLYLTYFISLNIGILVSSLIFDRRYFFYIPLLNKIQLQSVVTILNFHAVFFVGGLYFKKHPFIKTCLTVLLISLCITILLAIFGVTANAVRTSISGENYFMINRYWPEFTGRAIKLIFYCIVPIFCWIIAFYRLSEKQVGK